MFLCLSIGRNKHATLLSCYAPTMDSIEKVKESFYCNLPELLRRTSFCDKLCDGVTLMLVLDVTHSPEVKSLENMVSVNQKNVVILITKMKI